MKTEKEEAILYPELNQGGEVYDEDGILKYRRKNERVLFIPAGFVHSGIFYELNNSAVKLYFVLVYYSGKYRFTKVGNKKLIEKSGLYSDTVVKSLRELEYYHLISRNLIPSGSKYKRMRRIGLLRWETASTLLVKEDKIKLDDGGKILFLRPNPFRK